MVCYFSVFLFQGFCGYKGSPGTWLTSFLEPFITLYSRYIIHSIAIDMHGFSSIPREGKNKNGEEIASQGHF
jgi:hypothetical protein